MSDENTRNPGLFGGSMPSSGESKDSVSGKENMQPEKKAPKTGKHKISDSNLSGVADHPYLPAELIGGSIPHIPGTEEEAVWNAAAQACGTERIHFTYTVEDDKCWYLASPSSALSSHPDSWCPLAAALPGNPEFWDKETVYLYEQEGIAAAIRWDSETGRMQVFSGPARTILPRIQTMDANFITINPEKIKPIAWRSRRLNQEYLSRMTVKALVLSGTVVALIALLFWVATFTIASMMEPDLTRAKNETRIATESLMIQASKAMQSESSKHLNRIQELLDSLGDLGGTLVKYEVDTSGQVVWDALIPPALGGNNLAQFKASTVGRAEDGRLRIRGKR
jgi:hypothetical protein